MNHSSYTITLALSLPLWPERTTAHKALVADEGADLLTASYHLSRNCGAAERYRDSLVSSFNNACSIARECSGLTVTEQYA